MSNFQKLVFISLCRVLSFVGSEEAAMASKSLECVTKGRKSYRTELCQGVAWFIQLLDKLHVNGWGTRSGDLLYHCE